MLTQQILSVLSHLRNGGQSSPLLVAEAQVCEICADIFEIDIQDIEELSERGMMDFLYYDCGDKVAENHKAENVRKQSEKLYQKPAADILVAVFRNIDCLTDTSANALLRLFEDVPTQTLILVTSQSPEKIIPTLQSRMLMMSMGIVRQTENPLNNEIQAYLDGHPEELFALTLHKDRKFTREDALWVVRGLQDALSCGKLATRHASRLRETQIALETTNTIAKYLTDQLLISLACE